MKTGAALGQQQGQEGQQQEGGNATGTGGGGPGQGLHQRDVMDDLVDRLAALEESH